MNIIVTTSYYMDRVQWRMYVYGHAAFELMVKWTVTEPTKTHIYRHSGETPLFWTIMCLEYRGVLVSENLAPLHCKPNTLLTIVN